MPTTISQYRTILRRHLPELAAKHRVASLALFGSRVRGEEHAGSDLDVLVSFDEAPTLLEFIELEHELSTLLGVKVDLVMRDSLRPHVGERVLKEAVPV